MSTHSESPIVKKLRALLAKANDKSVTEHEAAMFAAKVQELLAANNLSMGDLKDQPQESIKGKYFDDSRWRSPARKILMRAVLRFYMCEAIGTRGDKSRWTIVGRQSNVIVALDMLDYLIKTVIRLSNEYGRENIGANVIDWRRGCMQRLSERLDEMRRGESAKKQETTATGNPGNLPALIVSEEKAVAVYLKQHMDIKYRKPKRLKHGVDALHGRAAADKINIHRPVGSSGGRLAIGSK